MGSGAASVAHRLPRMLLLEERRAGGAAQLPTYNLFSPPPACTKCGHRLRLRESIPVLSALFLRGRCAHCRERIESKYLQAELAYAAIGAASFAAFGFHLQALFAFVFVGTCLLLAYIDATTSLLPDALTIPFLASGLVIAALGVNIALGQAACGVAVGAAAPWILQWVVRGKNDGETIGLGDVKLLAGVGAWLGPLPALSTFAIATTLAVVYVFTSRMMRRRLELTLPLGPFIAAAAVALYIARYVLQLF